MNYDTSTQKRIWTIPSDSAHWRSDAERDLFAQHIWYMHEMQTEFGLVSTRRAFVSAAHYFHRYFAVNRIEDHPNTQLVALTCLYTASKVEEIAWKKFTHGSLQYRGYEARRICAAVPDVDMDALIDSELDLLEALGFNLLVHQTQPRPAGGSDDEKRETLLLMTTRDCLSKSPTEMGESLKRMDLATYDSFAS